MGPFIDGSYPLLSSHLLDRPCSLRLQARVTELETKLVKLKASEQSSRERYDVVSSKLKELISQYKVSGAIACLFNLYNSGDLLKKK